MRVCPPKVTMTAAELRPVALPLPDRLLHRASDEDLAEHFNDVSGQRTADETAACWQILAEMERRDR
jgi:hypothetical protein